CRRCPNSCPPWPVHRKVAGARRSSRISRISRSRGGRGGPARTATSGAGAGTSETWGNSPEAEGGGRVPTDAPGHSDGGSEGERKPLFQGLELRQFNSG